MPPAVIAGAIAATGAVAKAVIGSKAAKSAAKTQSRAALSAAELQFQGTELSIEEQRRQFDVALDLGAPRREAENEALNALRGLLGLGGEAPDFAAFERTPGFEFTRDEALQATERNAAARGGLVSGNTLTALQDRAAGLAGQNFLSTFLNPIQNLALGGAGAAAGNQAINLGVNVGNTIQSGADARASGLIGAGNATAAGKIGSANAITGGLAGINQAIQGTFSNQLLLKLLNSRQANQPINNLGGV